MLIGIVGKPSVGKSTFFRACTLADVAIASHPFTTIKPNRGVGYVKVECIEKEFNTKCQPSHGFCINNKRFVPVELMDVAGLVPGASEGKGLGNQFLDDLRQADAFIHILDISGTTNAEGKPLEEGENYNPAKDVRFLEEELNKWYYNILAKVWKSFARKAEIEANNEKDFSDAVEKQFSGLKIKGEQVKTVMRRINFNGKASTWDNEKIMSFASELRKESKPMIIAVNKIDKKNSFENYKNLKKEFSEIGIIPCSAEAELFLRDLGKNKLISYIPGEKEFKILKEDKITNSQKEILEKIKKEILEKYPFGTGVQEVLNKVVFDLLEYIAIFPASPGKLKDSKGRTLPDCFFLPLGSTALDFAYFLHTDFGENFIKAIDARTKKALSKNYKLKNRDALEIISR